ncbi:MAG: DUF4190 domain-containing protein [Thermoanaerobaculia bacterium]
MGEPLMPPPPAGKASSRATTALILGIVGLVCCPLCGPFAWFMGMQEGKAIKAGQSSAAGQGLATVGMVLGILGTLYFVFVLLWVLFFGGMAMLSALSSAASQ